MNNAHDLNRGHHKKITNTTLKMALTATILTGGLTASTAQAELITYDLQWSGLTFQNNASATGQVAIDTDLAPNPGFYSGQWAGSAFSNFSITITGAISGNGTFSTENNDFVDVIWTVGNNDKGFGGFGIDFHSELVGQDLFQDFNVFNQPFESESPNGGNPEAPNGWAQLVLLTGGTPTIQGGGGGEGDLIELVSMNPVPAPSSLALLGLTALATTRRRR